MAKVHTSLILTSGTALTRKAEVLTFPFKARPQAMSAYVRFVERGTIADPNGRFVWQIGGYGSNNSIMVLHESNVGFYRLYYRTSSGSNVARATLAAAPTYGQTVELLATISAAGVIALTQSINGATATTAAGNATYVLPAAWNNSVLTLGGTNMGPATAFRDIAIARGVLSLNAMRRLAGVAAK